LVILALQLEFAIPPLSDESLDFLNHSTNLRA
jgi:hypothetical protein